MYRRAWICKNFWVAAGLVLGLASAPAFAHDAREAPAPKATLSATASEAVEQDTVQVTLAAEVTGDDQATVSQQLNQRLDDVVKRAKGHTGIAVRSGNYNLWPSTDRDGKISQWRGQAEVVLTSTDFAATSRLAADLGDQMPIAGIRFSVSRELRAKTEQALLARAVDAFRARAKALTEALGYASYDLRSVDLGGAGAVQPPGPAPRMMSLAVADKVAAPLEAGEQTLSVSLQGVIVLQPR